MMQLKRILVPVDFSKEAELSLEWAVKLAKEEESSIIYLLHDLSPAPLVPELAYRNDELVADQWEKEKDDLTSWQKRIPAPIKSVILYAQGELSEDVANICNKENIDLVVITTHGRQGLSRVLQPNLSEKVVRLAPCPVMVLHLNPKIESMLT